MSQPKNKNSQNDTLVDKVLRFLGFKSADSTQTSSSLRNNQRSSGRSGSSKPRKKGAPTPVTSERLFIGNLSYSVDEAQLKKIFSAEGKVASAEIAKHRKSNRSKGFGFVTMASVDEAQSAAKKLDGKEIDGRPIAVSGAKNTTKKTTSKKSTSKKKSASTQNRQGSRRDDRSGGRGNSHARDRSSSRGDRGPRGNSGGKGKGRGGRGGKGSGSADSPTVVPMAVPEVSSPKLSITNLSEDFKESELADLFYGIGTISESQVSEGKATVEMESVEAAQKAVRYLDGKDFMGKTLSISESE